ncbi:MAG: sensor with HAMP domain protein, partial [Candidatus Latescibacteria bacterium]|nr:sensor with HAMP domain protein [Candidatus Latescibacterota bacterium]
QRSAGEVVSAISIRIPLDAAYANINQLVFQLSVFFGITLLIVSGFIIYFGKRWVFDPLSFVRKKAIEVSKSPKHLGEQIDLPSSFELSELTEAFNVMSLQLRQERDQLESRVVERTGELNNVNLLLTKEVDKHQMTIAELETTLEEIKTLSGILPICSHCKKIRNDEGYWDQIESYIGDRSEAEFSHSICQECAKKHYPNMDIYGDEETQG